MEKTKTRYFIPVAVWAIIMMTVSSIPNLGPPPINFTFVDKIEHFIEYSILGFFLAFALVKTRPKPALLVAILICAGYGIIDEIHQLFIPGRFCDPFDALADILGASTGILIYAAIKNRFANLSYRRLPVENSK
jgi:VanZ family protein